MGILDWLRRPSSPDANPPTLPPDVSDPRVHIAFFSELNLNRFNDNLASHAAQHASNQNSPVSATDVLFTACMRYADAFFRLRAVDHDEDPDAIQLSFDWHFSQDLTQAARLAGSRITLASSAIEARRMSKIAIKILAPRAIFETAFGPDRTPMRSAYASVLDAACPECSALDGRKYANLIEAYRDFKVSGGARSCTASRCRCSLVIILTSESPATLEYPYGPAVVHVPDFTALELIDANVIDRNGEQP